MKGMKRQNTDELTNTDVIAGIADSMDTADACELSGILVPSGHPLIWISR